jgi:protein-disulfide isomerase-like protein with CxxC motif
MDPEKFVKSMQTEETKTATETEFAICSQLGVTGFPTVFLIKDNKMHRIAEGYVPAGTMEGALQKIK